MSARTKEHHASKAKRFIESALKHKNVDHMALQWKEVKTKSRAGVEYIKYVPTKMLLKPKNA